MSTDQVKPEIKYRVGLSFFEGIGPIRFKVLLDYFGSVEDIYTASKKDLLGTKIGNALIEKFVSFRSSFDLEKFIAEFIKRGISVISKEDESYPQSLQDYSDAPFILYAIGDTTLLNKKQLFGVVGTRKPTRYGIAVTRSLSTELSRAGFIIVSGMAMGIDAVSHKAALDAGSTTIAVLGCGVDICYPAVNYHLYENIKQNGLVISEFPPGKRTGRGVFPSRNRIVAGLSRGVLVTEGAVKSGSLITARYASEYGKDVFSVPGPITSEMSGATTWLIQNGAKAVGSVEDILEEYKHMHRRKQGNNKDLLTILPEAEKIVAKIVSESGSVHIDSLTRIAGLPVSEILSIISSLEMKGVLVEVANEEYAIA